MADEITTISETETEIEDQVSGEEMSFNEADDDEWDAITSWGDDSGDADEDSNAEDEQPDEVEAEADQPEPEAQPEQEQAEEPTEEPTNPEVEEADQFLELKHMDEVRKVNREEAKVLAQKGLDYDRIRGERDSMQQDYQKLKGYESFLNELRGDFPTIDALITDVRARMIANKENISYADAAAKVKIMYPEQPVTPAAPKADQPKGDDAVQKFVERYPDVKAEEIPESVWAEVRRTGDLAGAYAKYEKGKMADEIASLRAEVKTLTDTLKQNSKNAARSPGSSTSSGKTDAKSLIQKLWEEDDY